MSTIQLRLDTLRALLPCASKDENMPNLCGVHVAVKDGTLRLTATDASVLATVSTPSAAAESLEAGLIVKRAAIEQILKVAGKKTVVCHFDPAAKTLSADSFNVADVCIDSAFPNVWRLLPTPDEARPDVFPPFDVRNVAKFEALALLRYAGGATKKDLSIPIMTLIPCGPPPKPILVRIDGRTDETIEGVISPCKGPATDGGAQ